MQYTNDYPLKYSEGLLCLKKGDFRGAEGAAKKILSTFYEIFGKFANKDAIKRDFWGGVGRHISKFSKNTHFWEKNTRPDFPLQNSFPAGFRTIFFQLRSRV